MTRPVIVIATAIVIVIAGLIIFKMFWPVDTSGPTPGVSGTETAEINDDSSEINADSSGVRQPKETPIVPSTSPTQPVTRTEAETVSVSINAIPWARVFIKLPENDYFMEPRPRDFTIPPKPNQKDSNVTPIPGDLKVPSGTAIKLMYRGKEKIFLYEKWKDGKTISHDFLNQ